MTLKRLVKQTSRKLPRKNLKRLIQYFENNKKYVKMSLKSFKEPLKRL